MSGDLHNAPCECGNEDVGIGEECEACGRERVEPDWGDVVEDRLEARLAHEAHRIEQMECETEPKEVR